MSNNKKLIKKDKGVFSPNEIAIFGSNDTVIVDFSQKTSKKLQKKYKIDFFSDSNISQKKDVLSLSQLDFLLLNGNYFNTKQQILILDSNNENFIVKNVDLLTNVQFVVKLDSKASYPKKLIEVQPSIINLIVYDFTDFDSICNHIENLILEKIAPLNGLILIGGTSSRMGTDKSLLDYYGKPHRNFLADLLGDFILSNHIFFSVREDSQATKLQTISDKFANLGPFGGICSAFMHNPNAAWLVIATDLPFVTADLLKLLISKRNTSKIATTFIGNSNTVPEPLITIWEPKAYPILLHALSQGELSLTKILINNAVEIIEVANSFIKNINTKDAFDAIINDLTD